MVVCLDDGVLACLDNNDKDYFNAYFIHAQPLEYILEENFGEKILVHHGFMQKTGWCDTYVHFCYRHNYKNQMIYHDHLNYGR